jgi:hypothetical protein
MTAARHAAPHIPHAIARAKDRYGLDLTGRDLGKIARMIQTNQGKLDKQHADGKTQWFLTYRDVPLRVVISQDFYKIITFIPLRDDPKPPKRKRKKVWRGGKAIWVEKRA